MIADSLLTWLPAVIVVPLAIFPIKKKRIAIPLILLLYFGILIAIIFFAHLSAMVETGKGDPQLVAGAISEDIVTGLLRSFFDLPLLFLMWFFFRRQKLKKQE